MRGNCTVLDIIACSIGIGAGIAIPSCTWNERFDKRFDKQ